MSDLSRCPFCNSFEVFERGAGQAVICLVCFKKFSPKAVISPPRARRYYWFVVGALAVTSLGLTALGFTTLNEKRVTRTAFAGMDAHRAGQAAPPERSPVEPASLVRMAQDEDRRAPNMFGDKPWTKGSPGQPQTCMPLAAGMNPKDDLERSNTDASLIGAALRDGEYDLVYQTQTGRIVYSSSLGECRRFTR